MTESVNRREFLVAGSLVAAGTAVSAAEEKPEPRRPSPLDVTLAQIVLQYPDQRLDAAALDEIRQDVQQHQVRSAYLSAYPLANSDEPGFVFEAYRKD